MKDFLEHMKMLMPLYLVIILYAVVHFYMHNWYPVLFLLLSPVVALILIVYINKRIKGRKQF